MQGTPPLMNHTNGQSAPHTSRKQEEPAREGAWQGNLLSEAYPPKGSSSGKAEGASQRIVNIENAQDLNKSLLVLANTTQEIETELVNRFGFDTSVLGFYFSNVRAGTLHRKNIEGALEPSMTDIYVRLYLKKHPPLSK